MKAAVASIDHAVHEVGVAQVHNVTSLIAVLADGLGAEQIIHDPIRVPADTNDWLISGRQDSCSNRKANLVPRK